MKFHLLPLLLVTLTATNAWCDEPEVQAPRTVTITISPETTYFTGPLLPDGRVDYYGAMHQRNSVGITKDNNILSGVFQIIPGERESSLIFYPDLEENKELHKRVDDYRRRYWQCLGFDSPPAIESLRFLHPAAPTGKELEYLLKYYTPEEIFSRLPNSVLPKDDDKNLEPLEYLKKLQEENHWFLRSTIFYDWNGALSRLWTEEDFPLLADWIAATDEMTQQLIEISKRPKFYNPVIASSDEDEFLYSALLPYVQGIREVARFMSIRGNWHFARGEYDEAFECAFAPQRIGLAVRTNNTFIVEDLVGIAVHGIGTHRLMTYLMELDGRKDAEWLAAKRARFIANQEAYPIPAVPQAINWERCGMLSAIQIIGIKKDEFSQMIEESDEPQEENPVLHMTMLLDKDANYDWDRILRLANEYFDDMEDILYLPGAARRDRALLRQENRLTALRKELGTRSPDADPERFIVDSMYCLLSPALRAAMAATTRAKFNTQAPDIMFALAMYRAEHGEYPETLEQLVPKYLDAVPVSPFSEKPVRYVKRTNMLLLASGDDCQLDGSDEALEKLIAENIEKMTPHETVGYLVPYIYSTHVYVLRY